MKGVVGVVVAVVLLAVSAGSGAARPQQAATVGVYPSGTTIAASSAAPKGASASVSLAMPARGVDDATILVHGAGSVAVASAAIASPLRLQLLFAHYVSVDGRAVPDALLPWDGSERSAEHANQPVWVQVTVPYGTAAGTYRGSLQVVADGRATTVPITVGVFPVTLPQPGEVPGSLLTAFNVSPQSYGAEVSKLYGVPADRAVPGLFGFLSSYRLSPNNWGYGNPHSASGYATDSRWWLDSAGQMVSAVGNPRRFASMWIPVSSNRWSRSTYVAGLSPYAPQTWCSYLRSVRAFWQSHGWLDSYPYLWGIDEGGGSLAGVVRRQAEVTHRCFPGGHVIMTGNPSQRTRPLWNGGKDDVDTWAVLASRYYGEYTTPAQQRAHVSRATEALRLIEQARKRHEQIWTYTYDAKAHSTPGLGATEPLADPRMLVDWAALEGITGLLYGQGTTTYGKSDPLVSNDRANGGFVLVYPGRDGPVPSARLEVLREGIEDWEILNVVRHEHGAREVRKLLSGLFSTSASGTRLGCTIGCRLRTETKYSWPTWSRDASTPGKLAAMRAAALRAAS